MIKINLFMKNIFDSIKLHFVQFATKLKIFSFKRKKIVVLLGNKGVFLSTFLDNKLLDKLFIPTREQIDLNPYKNFFSKFPKSDIYFLLDGRECKTRHDQIPILQSIVKLDPIEQFIEGYFNKEDIIAHCVYEITTTPSEIWSTLIMSYPFETPLSDIISCIIDKRSLDLKGIYFLTLELKVIINKIVQNIENDKYNDYFQICVYVSQASGIKFIIKHKNNIITIRNLEYPFDKTTGYVQGIIEQEINDCLILFKNYISTLDQRACIILIVDEELKSLLESTNFEERPVIFIPVDNILNKQTLEKERFIDTNISRLFLEYKSFPAYNNNLKSIKKLVTIKDLTFKLYSALLIILILVVGIIKYNTKQNYKDINSINEKYYATNQEYDGLKYKYPYIKNTTSLADLYVIEKLLEAPVPLPFDLLKRLIITLNPAFKLEEIKWELTNIDNSLLVSKRQLIIKLILKYHTNNLSVDESLKMLDDYMTNVKNKLSNLQIDYVIYKDKILDIFGQVVIPLSVNIVDNKT
ncbi:hypothetical protein MCC_00785 [Rickettsia rhipicephali str. 3-7-female6-CWPP]|uniref:Glycyl-tRNA synthetase subunit alpha n=1 Tax=Rickettsia rhipicephali (strain 3-7-female6-CWPP) TaxID=1105113 RepID=A0AAI8F6K9_RICR3|nr:hypothetical protein [Rickettsia rhipicephali]AFC71832.1 hypothetical protein MCC_00785 [Rickettsia rhipicephali str. 3-7-female6-CWPP]